MKQVSTTQFTQASLTKKESKVNEVDSGMMIKECISDFLIEQQIKGNSPATVKSYARCLSFFERFQAQKSSNIVCVTVSDCKAYYLYLLHRDISSVTIQTYIRALRVFLSWCYSEGYINENIPERFKLPKAQRKR